MKCISLWQPWASLMAIGAKRIETRSWATSHRGLLAIHAAKRDTPELRRMAAQPPFSTALRAGGVSIAHSLPMGCILAVVNLDDCIPTALAAAHGDESEFGDYTPGRFAWRTGGLRRLGEPVQWRGAQGLFDVPDDVVLAALGVTREAIK